MKDLQFYQSYIVEYIDPNDQIGTAPDELYIISLL